MTVSPAAQAEALRYLRTIRVVSKTYSAPSPFRRMLVVGGRWKDTIEGDRSLVLIPGSTILLETRSRILLEFIFEESYFLQIAKSVCQPDTLFEVKLISLTSFVRDFNLASGSRDSYVTDAHGTPITLPVRNHRTWNDAGRLKAITLFNCTISVPPDAGLRSMRGRLLRGVYNAEDVRSLPKLPLPDTPSWKTLRKALVSFSQDLDQESIALCRKIDKCGSKLYAYLRHDRSPLIRRSRHEAIDRFPFLAEHIVAGDAPEAVTMRTIIDQGGSPVGPTGSAIVVSRDIVRTVAGKSEEDLGLRYEQYAYLPNYGSGPWRPPRHFAPSRMFRALAMVSAEQRPTSRIQWLAFQEMASRMDQGWYAGVVGDIGVNLLRSLAGMGWPAMIPNGHNATPLDLLLEDLSDIFHVCIDGLQSAVRTVMKTARRAGRVTPDSLRAACSSEIKAFASRTGLRKLAFISHRWHTQYALAMEAVVKKLPHALSSESLVPLLQEPIEIEGLSIVQMLTRSDFFLEGVAMAHCVASRFYHGRTGQALYFSVRSASGEHISTFDISVRRVDDVLKVVLNDHRGPENVRPAQQVVSAVEEFVRQLQQGELEEDAIRYVERTEAMRISQVVGNSDRLDETVKRAERNARRRAAQEVLRGHIPKMLENVLREIGRGK